MNSIQLADVANIQDQFKLIAIRSQNQDEAAERFNNVFQAFADEIKKSNQALSDRILVLENEKAAAQIKAEAIAKAHYAEVEALRLEIASLKNRQNELSNTSHSQLSQTQNELIKLEQRINNHQHGFDFFVSPGNGCELIIGTTGTPK